MRIFSKKAFAFRDPDGQQAEVTVRAQAFADVPDWVQNSTMFKWATNDADIQIMNSAADVTKAENDADSTALKELKAAAKALGIQGYTKMNADDLTIAIENATKNENDGQNTPSE